MEFEFRGKNRYENEYSIKIQQTKATSFVCNMLTEWHEHREEEEKK